MKKSMPYFDLIFDALKDDNVIVKTAFSDFVHWGLWAKGQKITPKGYQKAQKRLTQTFFKYLKPQNTFRILDVGCGNGGPLRMLNASLKEARLVGINIDKRQLSYAKQQTTPKHNNKVSFKHMDACKMNFKEDSFDSMYALESIFHFPSREKFLRDANKILKKNGKLALTDFVPVFPFNFVFSFIDRCSHVAKNIYGPVNFDILMRKYRKLFRAHNFELEEVVDVTRATLPTYDVISRHVLPHLDKKYYRAYTRVNFLMKLISRLGIYRYKMIIVKNIK